MSFYRGMTCENVTINGNGGTPIGAYVAKPSGTGPFPGVVLIHHLPGWSELYIETTRRFAHHGYIAICANLHEREGQEELDAGARAGVELTLESAKELRGALDRAIAAAEFEEAEVRGKGAVPRLL